METLGESSDTNAGTPSKFLFVNETGDPTAYKPKIRQEVRSHVRKHTAKRFKEIHKTGRKGKEEKLLPKTPPTIHTQTFPSTQYHGDCPSSLTVALSSASNLTFSLLDTGILSSGRGLLPAGQQLVSGDSSGLYSNSSSSMADNPEVDESQIPAASPYRKDSDGLLDGEQQLSQSLRARLFAKMYFAKKLAKLSPVEILGSGRVDPFSTYPTANPNHELIDLAATYLIPGLIPDDFKQIGQSNSASRAWVRASLRTPALFHAIIFASKVHQDYGRWSQILPNSPALLSHKLTTIRLLGEIMRDGDEASRTSDEVILVILALASHEVVPVGEDNRNPFNAPLKRMKWANLYGNIQYVPEHLKAVLDIIAFRGGIEKIKLYGVAELLVAGHIVSATNSVSKPVLPLLRMYKKYITDVRAWATSPLRSPAQLLASGFWHLQDYGLTDAMLQVFDAMGSTAVAIDHYLQGKPNGLTEGAIARTRLAAQQSLLLLPSDAELNIIPLSRPCLYEGCRLTGVIFGAVVMCSIPNTYDLFKDLTQRLRSSLESSRLEDLGSMSFEVQNAILWMLVLGGIASLGNAERPWFVSQIVRMIKLLSLDWDHVTEILETFLWFDSACGIGGRILWSEAMGFIDLKV